MIIGRKIWVSISLFFIALAPVSNLFVAWVLHGENDRYGYLASLFFFIALVALFQFLEKWLKYGLYFILICVSISFSNQLTGFWKNSSDVVTSLLADF